MLNNLELPEAFELRPPVVSSMFTSAAGRAAGAADDDEANLAVTSSAFANIHGVNVGSVGRNDRDQSSV